MAQTNINIRMDEDLKRQFDQFCGEIGMSMTTAFTIFAKTTVREHRIPFELAIDPFYSAENQAILQKSIADYEQAIGTPVEIAQCRSHYNDN